MCLLATSESERYKDIIKVAEITLTECESFISFEHKYSNSDTCYAILEKGYIVTAKWLSKGIELMEECFK